MKNKVEHVQLLMFFFSSDILHARTMQGEGLGEVLAPLHPPTFLQK